MIGFCPLASGSKGNAIFLGTKQVRILIDAGMSGRQTQARLAELGIDWNTLDAVLVTHEHMDHIQGLKILSGKMKLPILANSDTARGICRTFDAAFPFQIFTTNEPFQFGDLLIHPFSIQHDTMDPVGFVIEVENLKLGFCTDLGFASTGVKNKLLGCDYLYLEANHQPSMVYASPRPFIYKQRVLSRQGHLSNEECADLLSAVFHPKLKHVHLAHLSSECNHPDLAKKIVEEKLLQNQQSVEISIAYQEKLSRAILF